MMSHRTGVIGLPLRLLAREVYDRLVDRVGPSVVALVTGEEKIVPARARYWVCTVEAMPVEIGADFVAVDEIQLCADFERGHIFTDRLLNMRGLIETMFLGSETIKSRISELVSNVVFERRERMSTLSYSGSRKLSRMRPRTAIVGFSINDVYAIAEVVRRLKGGAAVVMGALSPRTRNAQVAMYQEGEVDYLVATDAIGMGLNLDIHHVAFSGVRKFDGARMRNLMPHELGQIAGRAGRHSRDGTFGVTGDVAPFEPNLAAAIENGKFQPIAKLQWRNSRLDFGSVDGLLRSLEHMPDEQTLVRARPADDENALRALAQNEDIMERILHPSDVRLLWDVVQIPDFRKVSSTDHAELLARIFGFVSSKSGQISADWFAGQLKTIDKVTGDIDTLSKRLAFVRTWTYVSQRQSWLEDAAYWQGKSREIEDRLSDALHQALTQRFVDRRTSVLMRRLKQRMSLVAEVNKDNEVHVDGQFIGKLHGFRFQLDPGASADEAKTLRSAAAAALQPEFILRSERLYNAPDTEIDLTEQGGLMWGDDAVGKLHKSGEVLAPDIEVFVDDAAGADVAEKVKRRLSHWLSRRIDALFEPLLAIQKDETLSGLAKGVGHQLVEALGIIPRAQIAHDVKALDQDARATLRKHGVRFGQYTLFMPLLLKPAPTRLRLVLAGLFEGLEEFPAAPPPGLVTVAADSGLDAAHYMRAGYRLAGERAIRVDMLERLADLVRAENARDGFESNADMLSITGLSAEQFAGLMEGLGYAVERGERDKPPKAAPPAVESDDAASDVEDKPSETGVGADSKGEVPEEDLKEAFYIFRWAKKPSARPQGKKPQRGKRNDKKQGGPRSNTPRTASASPKKKAVDPDNPFAALAALKDKG
jgi:ATP-dependent RNA helicase SUPV3L1/SUV3